MKPTVALVLACLLLGACGDEAATPPASAPTADEVPALPAVDPAAKARFALDRLLQGPLPRTGAFAIPKIHQLNLEHARADLIALRVATLDLLSDPELIDRLTRPAGDHNPWHNILQVLAWFDDLPAQLALAWCRPVREAKDLQLDRRAVRVLLAVDDGDAIAPLMLELFTRRPGDRELGPLAFRALVHLGAPWRQRAVDVTLRGGGALLWSRVPSFLQTADAEGRPAVDALAWWAVLSELTGPAAARGTSRTVAAPWFRGRLIADDAVWPRDLAALEAAVLEARVLAPATVLDAEGYLPTPQSASSVLAWRQALLSGRGAAADARCRLAESGYAAHRATVARDLEGTDPLLLLTAERCAVTQGDPESLELQRIVLDTFLEDVESGMTPEPTGVLAALLAVNEAAPAEGAAAALRILEHARPQVTYQGLLDAAHDALVETDPDALGVALTALLRSDESEDRAIALLHVRRGRHLRHAAVLDDLLSAAGPAEASLIQRLLIWLHTRPQGVDAEARRAFAVRYGAWVDRAPDGEANGLAPGLLDLGEGGADAYAAGLGGPRRAVYVRGLLGRVGLVALPVARALLGPVDSTTSPMERHAVLVAAYRVAPAGAAPDLAALRARIAAADRAEVDDVLEVVRHRAERDR